MKRIGLLLLCLILAVCLCACGNGGEKPDGSSAPSSDVDSTPETGDTDNAASCATSTTIGALVVTDAQGGAVTNVDGSLVTTHVGALPTVVRPVTNAGGSTATEADGTVKTEIVIPPHITVVTDEVGTLHTSVVPEQTVTTTKTNPAPTSTTRPTAGSTNGAVTKTTLATAATTGSTQSKVTTSAGTTGTTKPTQQEGAQSVVLPKTGKKLHTYIVIGSVSLSGNEVSLELKNVSTGRETDGESYFEYTCYDKNNVVLAVDKIEIGFIPTRSGKIYTFTIPENTDRVALTDCQAEYWSKLV